MPRQKLVWDSVERNGLRDREAHRRADERWFEASGASKTSARSYCPISSELVSGTPRACGRSG